MSEGDQTARQRRIQSAADGLRAFLVAEMAMSHVYQPVMIRTLLEGGGAATRRQIAVAFSAADLSQIEYYEQVVARYPGPVLRRRGIVAYDKGVYRLTGDLACLDQWQTSSLVAVCEARLADFVARRQASIWRHRATNVEPVVGTLRWQVLKRAMGRCEACGVSALARALEVDHIMPRTRGGTNDLWNLQALCSVCNLQKLDRDETDFHAAHRSADQRHQGCRLCDASSDGGLENALAQVILLETGPVVVPRRHGVSYFELWQSEVNAMRELEIAVHKQVRVSDMQTEMVGAKSGDAGHLALGFRS